jgi:hypothetical protein
LFEYETLDGEPHEIAAKNINPYLADAVDVLISRRDQPICEAPEINKGSEATDFGHLFLEPNEKASLVASTPNASRWLRRVCGGEELINGVERWCLWLVGAGPEELRRMPEVLERVERVRKGRESSGKARTKEWAAQPSLFSENRQPDTAYLAVPKVSSERRNYLPIAHLPPEIIATGSLQVLPNATVFHFGVLSSSMHMAWLRYTCGRMKSDYQYSNSIVYNNFPWPEIAAPSTPAVGAAYAQGERSRGAIEAAAQAVLDARAQFPEATLADLYDPLTMPPPLVKAHQQLDKAVDAAYVAAEKAAGRKAPKLGSDAERVAFLFERYQALTSLLPAATPAKPRASQRKSTKSN